MRKPYVLLADDLRDKSSSDWQRSTAIKNATKFMADRLKLNIKMIYIDNIAKKSHHLKSFDFKRATEWKNQVQALHRQANKQFNQDVDLTIQPGSPSEQIIETVNTSPKPELLIMGTRNRKTLKSLFLGSVCEDVLRHSRQPVMVLGPKALSYKFNRSRKEKLNIVLFSDLKHNSINAEEYARSLAKELDANLTVCFSVGDQVLEIKYNVYSGGFVADNIEETFKAIYANAARSLQKKIRTLKTKGVHVEGKLLTQESQLANIISAEIKRGYDLVIMGTRGRSKVLRAFVGSSTRSAVLNSVVPIIVVPS